ncbi:MAG: ATP-binding cassette domain-containing protein [Anaerolineaceae bacterium]|nr:ATP-binding cassette domain-containing protein [Anaerolineaceae bacterium]
MMTGFRHYYFIAVVTLAVSALMNTSSFLLVGHFVDNILPSPNVGRLAPLVGLGFVLLAGGQGLFSFLSGRFAARTAEGLALRLRDAMYDHVQRLSFTYHDNMQTGELLSRATSDLDAIRRFFADQAIGVGRILLLFTVNFIAIFSLNANLALASIVVVPFIALLSLFFFGRISRLYEKLQDQEAKVSTTLQENLSGVRVVKAFNRQNYEREKFEVQNFEHYKRGRRFLVLHALFWPLSDVLVFGQIVGGYFLGASLVINGTMSIGSYLAYVSLLGQLINPMRNLGRLLVDMSTGIVSYKRMMEVIGEEQESLVEGAHQPAGDLHGDIEFKNVNFEYNADTPVLHDISLTVKAGQSVALLGSTGSGKTSFVNLIPRFYQYTSGSIKIDGVELQDIPRGYLRGQIGVVEQEPFLFSRSIRDNITFSVSRKVTNEEVVAAAKAAAVHDVIMTFPEGYNTLVGERGVTLSGGQKQRVVLARALLKNPRILILDDATSSVDSETEDEIRQALLKLMRGRTSFIIAHRIQTVMHANLILVFDKGRIVQRGTHSELMREPGIYRKVFELQSRVDEEVEKEAADVLELPV